ncbi:MAG: hypothetical protein KKG10_17995 [Proteobacteria bacterium]|nr:hypothetical protein [Pseudomonadota bacterium]
MMWVIFNPARFWVTRIPMDRLEKEQIMDWVEDAWATGEEKCDQPRYCFRAVRSGKTGNFVTSGHVFPIIAIHER